MLARGNTEEAARLRRSKSIPVVAARRSLAPTYPEDPLAAFKTAITAASCAFDKAKHEANARGSLDRYLHSARPAPSPKKTTTRRPHTAQGQYLAKKNSEGRLHARQQAQATKRLPNVLPKSGRLNLETRLPQGNNAVNRVSADKDPPIRASTRHSDRLSLSTDSHNRTLLKTKSAYTPRTPASSDAPSQHIYGRRRQICTNTNTVNYQDSKEPISSFSDVELASSYQAPTFNHGGSGSRSSAGLRTLKSIIALPPKLRGTKSYIDIQPIIHSPDSGREASNYIDAYGSQRNKNSLRNRAKAITTSVRTRVENAFKRSPGTGIHSPLRYQQMNANRLHYGSGIVTDPSNIADFDSAQHVEYTYDRFFSPSPHFGDQVRANSKDDRAMFDPYEIDLTQPKLAESRMTSWENSSAQAISQHDIELSSSAGTTVQNRDFSFPNRSTDTYFSERRVGRIPATTKHPVDTKRLHSALLKKIEASPIIDSQPPSVLIERLPSCHSSISEVNHTKDAHSQSSTVRLIPVGATSGQSATALKASRFSVVSPSVYSPMMSIRRSTIPISHPAIVDHADCGTAVVTASQPVAKWRVGRIGEAGQTRKPNTSNDWRAWVSNEVSGIESVTKVLPEGYFDYGGPVKGSEATWTGAEIVSRQPTYHSETASVHHIADINSDWDHHLGVCSSYSALPLRDAHTYSTQDPYDQNMFVGADTIPVTHDEPDRIVSRRLASDGHRTISRTSSARAMNDRFPWLDRRRTSAREPSAEDSRTSSAPSKRIPSRHAVAETICDFAERHPVYDQTHFKSETLELPDLPVLTPRLSSKVHNVRAQALLRNPSRTRGQSMKTNVDVATKYDQETRGTMLTVGGDAGKPCFSPAEYPLDEKFLRRIQKGPYLPMSPSPSPPRPKGRLTRQSTSLRQEPSFGTLRNVENVPLRPRRFMFDTFLESRSTRSHESTNGDESPAFL